MTKSEAISWLRGIAEHEGEDVPIYEEDVEALDLAIQALESQPCDAISREDAINTAIDAVDEWDGGCNTNRATMICKAIKKIPSVQPQQGWIPCSERLPEVGDEVLVTCADEVGIAWLEPYCIRWLSNDFGDAWIDKYKPIAWQPLPQPYKAESEG